ncbi:MAG TPA: ATP-binding protein, partial [Tepidisphaeraceae bacterium]|nr:ATP-binding protein [Tepidisphaeraceae bacterium]
REIVQSFRSTHPDRSLQYTSSGELTGHWDAARLRQLISNLLGNALQHGSTQAPVELTAAAEDGTVMLQVRNQGDPIPAHMLNAIFDPLVRHATPETAHRRPPGSIGLGLYIVREIAVAHGGSVEVASTHDTGTTFTVRLPRRLHPSQEHPPARERSA